MASAIAFESYPRVEDGGTKKARAENPFSANPPTDRPTSSLPPKLRGQHRNDGERDADAHSLHRIADAGPFRMREGRVSRTLLEDVIKLQCAVRCGCKAV